jgi:biopolymer transport protein ExbD
MLPRKPRKIPQINAASSADIAFLLLVFFLVTSSFDQKLGVYKQQPAPIEHGAITKRWNIEPRNLLTLTINADNQILHNGEILPLQDLRKEINKFIAQADTTDNRVSLEVDRAAKYQTYLSVLSELSAVRKTFPLNVSESEIGEKGGNP